MVARSSSTAAKTTSRRSLRAIPVRRWPAASSKRAEHDGDWIAAVARALVVDQRSTVRERDRAGARFARTCAFFAGAARTARFFVPRVRVFAPAARRSLLVERSLA